jgi:hypothetical protein
MAPRVARTYRIPRIQREKLLKDRHFLLACAAGFFILAFLTILFGGDPLRPAREALRIEWMVGERRGVYASCRDAGNTLNRFCRRDYENQFNRSVVTPSRFDHPNKEAPFSLSGTD